jgi:acyl dehydratase
VVHVGQEASAKRTLAQSDFDRFAALSGDDNPIHVDPEFSARTKFGRTVAHGMFLYSVVSGVLGAQLPGPGAMQVEQDLMFPSATYVGEEITVRLEVTRVQQAGGLVDLTTLVVRPDGNLGLQGRTLVRLPNVSPPSRATHLPSNPLANQHSSQSFESMRVGQHAEIQRVFALADLAEYADLTGDKNPVVTDAGFARTLGLQGQVIPGGLLGGLFSFLLGTRLPGRGTNYLKQKLQFPCPAYPGQELAASVEIVRIRPEKQLVNLSTVCTNPEGDIVCHGEALVLVSDIESGA